MTTAGNDSRFMQRAPGARSIGGALKALGIRPRLAVILVPYIWLTLFFLVPFLFVLKISFAELAIAQPPFTPLFVCADKDVTSLWTCFFSGRLRLQPSLASYGYLFDDALYFKAYWNSVQTAFWSTLLCLLIGYPMAYGIARSGSTTRNALLMLIVLPFWTSFLIRVYAWIGLLKTNGVINNILVWAGIIHDPLPMMNTQFAVYVGIVYSYLPFMILPLYANLEKMDLTLLEAAADLGCRPLKAFFAITVPLSFPGIVAGSMLVFIPAVGEYVIPELLGGSNTVMIGREIVNVFFESRDWPTASAIAVFVLLLLVVPITLYQYYQNKETEAGK
ncbi:MAG TPA: ABC transporter permease subunit [Dongiaceae bacterium]|jgi:putrescine transport system permease protein|nr:ABC transporter permease subunit [Dongiaceae bacterium]